MMKTIFFRCFLSAALDGDDAAAAGVRSVMVSNCMGRSLGHKTEKKKKRNML